ncbi:unnamed protein product, partial [Urochloa humidicola]
SVSRRRPGRAPALPPCFHTEPPSPSQRGGGEVGGEKGEEEGRSRPGGARRRRDPERRRRRRPPSRRPLLRQRRAGTTKSLKKTTPSVSSTPMSPEERDDDDIVAAWTPTPCREPRAHSDLEPGLHRVEPSRHHLATAPPSFSLRPIGSSEDPEDPDYFDDVDYAEEKDKDNTSVCEFQVRTWCTSPIA